MAKIINGATISSATPKMFETSDSFLINGQLYNKTTLEPIKFQTIHVTSTNTDSYMDCHADPTALKVTSMYETGNVITDRYQPEYSYSLACPLNGTLMFCKFKSVDGSVEKVYQRALAHAAHASASIAYQDALYLYGVMYTTTSISYIFRIDKNDGTIALCDIGSTYSNVSLIKETALFIYYAYSREYDKFVIGKYNKMNCSKTDIFADNGKAGNTSYTISKPIVINENEVLALRGNTSFTAGTIDKLNLKKYMIDYTFDQVYAKDIDLDCSGIAKGIIPRINDSQNWNETFTFVNDGNVYFSLWNRADKSIYLVKKTTDYIYTVIQEYKLSNSYNGVIPYNDGKTLMLYSANTINFMSFRGIEEKYELTSSLYGSFSSICIDRNKTVWIQSQDSTMEMVGMNIPTIAEALFTDTDFNYANEDIETYVEVFCKNFDGKLIEANLDVILNGPIKFSDTGLNKKRLRTSANSVVRIPVTITNSGFVEANAVIK